MIPPIPRSLLPDSMEVRVPVSSDYGGKFAEPVTVGHVRFDMEEGVPSGGVTTPDGRPYCLADGPRGTVYVDRVNSDGAFAVPVASRVRIASLGERDLSVTAAAACAESNGRIHHWELTVA